MTSTIIPPLVAGRSCDGCTLCCKVLSITEFAKPQQEWCTHCDIGHGCKIYATKPSECTTFYCHYLFNDNMGDEWKPTVSRMVVTYEAHAKRLVVHVDAARPDAWKKPLYYNQIKQWAIRAVEYREQVLVWQGLNAVVILPDRDKNVGRVRQDQLIISSKKKLGTVWVYDAELMQRDDPRLAGLNLPTADDPKPTGTA